MDLFGDLPPPTSTETQSGELRIYLCTVPIIVRGGSANPLFCCLASKKNYYEENRMKCSKKKGIRDFYIGCYNMACFVFNLLEIRILT